MQRSGSLAQKSVQRVDPFRTARPPATLTPLVEAQPAEFPDRSSERGPQRGLERLDNGLVLVAFSPAMRALRRQIAQIADTDAPVLLVGECGTGKELVARAIHKISGRSAGAFVKVSCAAASSDQLQLQRSLVGNESSGWVDSEPGRTLDAAEHRTIFLDSLTDLPLSLQAGLPDLLGEDGPPQPHSSHGRVISAAGEDVRKALEQGTLRADVYYRLSVFTLRIPPLRERREDLPHLLNQMMDTWAEAFLRPRLPITRRMLDASESYSWPGNLREMENFVKRYLVLGDEQAAIEQLNAGAEAVPPAAREEGSIHIVVPVRSGCLDMKSLMRDIKKDAERAAIVQALERTGGNKQKAARLLRISLRSLHYKVRAYHIDSLHGRPQGEFGAASGPSAGAAGASAAAGGSGKILTMDRVLPAAS